MTKIDWNRKLEKVVTLGVEQRYYIDNPSPCAPSFGSVFRQKFLPSCDGSESDFYTKILQEVVRILEQGGANIDINKKRYESRTLLHWAAYRGDLDMCTILVMHGADVNVEDDEGRTPCYETHIYNVFFKADTKFQNLRKNHQAIRCLFIENGGREFFLKVDKKAYIKRLINSPMSRILEVAVVVLAFIGIMHFKPFGLAESVLSGFLVCAVFSCVFARWLGKTVEFFCRRRTLKKYGVVYG